MCIATYKVVGINVMNEETILFEGTSTDCYGWIADNQSLLEQYRFYIDNPNDQIKLRKNYNYFTSFNRCSFLEAKRLCLRSTPEKCLTDCIFARHGKAEADEAKVVSFLASEAELRAQVKRVDTGQRRRASDVGKEGQC